MKRKYNKIPRKRGSDNPRKREHTETAEVLSNAGQVLHVQYDGKEALELKRRGTFMPYMIGKMLEVAKLGLTTEQIAFVFDITTPTLYRWMKENPDFRSMYDQGKWIHDHSVQTSLLKRATGYSYDEVKVVEGKDAFGRKYNYTHTTTRHVPADTTAMIFWLKNRHRNEWADVQHTHNSLAMSVDVKKTLELELLTEEERKMVASVALKQIASGNGNG